MRKYETNRTSKGLSPRQQAALPFFLGDTTNEEALEAAGVGKKTYYEWLKDPIFKRELDNMRTSVFEEAVGRLRSNTTEAANVLIALLKSENEVIRRAVANDILTHAVRLKEVFDLAQRIEKLEKMTYVELN